MVQCKLQIYLFAFVSQKKDKNAHFDEFFSVKHIPVVHFPD